MSAGSAYAGMRLPTPDQCKPFGRKLALICCQCGKTARYDVGAVIVDPETDENNGSNLENSIYFSGYFRCRSCNAPGPWKLPSMSILAILGVLIRSRMDPENAPISFGKPMLFDGTKCRSAAESEAYLLSLIEQTPGDDYLWSRLGNLFCNCGEPQRAKEAREKAVELNPKDVESLYHLGCYWQDRRQWDRSAGHFHAVLLHCERATRIDRGLLRDIVRATLERLLDLHDDSNGRIEVFPGWEPRKANGSPKDCVPAALEIDLSSDDGRDELVDVFLHQSTRLAGQQSGSPDMRMNEVQPPVRRKRRIGRNQACPCGSGKKYKHCCQHRRN